VSVTSKLARTNEEEREVLTRHPQPRPTESLMGYALRVSQANGFQTPWPLFVRAGLEQYEIRGSGFRYEKLAEICDCSLQRLGAIAYSRPESDRECNLLNHPLIPADLDFESPRVCPQCVQRQGFIEAHWDLGFMIGCPVHSCFAVTSCPKCNLPVGWYRPALLRCRCGASLADAEPGPLPNREASLLEILRSKVLGLLPFCDFGSGLPIEDMYRLELRGLLKLISVLMACSSAAIDGTANRNKQCAVSVAADVLSDWPARFFLLLEMLGARTLSGRFELRSQFAPLYNALLRQGHNFHGNTDFLRKAFLEFVSNHWGRFSVDPRLMKELRSGAQPRFITRTELARSLGVDPRSSLLRTTGEVAPIQPANSESLAIDAASRPVFDRSAVQVTGNSPGRIVGLRAAAKMIGIPTTILRNLKESGEYEINHLVPSRPGFHELDIQAFIIKLLVRARVCTDRDLSDCMSFAKAMSGRYGSPEGKTNVVRAMLSGAVPLLRDEGEQLSALLIPRAQIQRFAENERSRVLGNARTPTEASKLLRCDVGSIPELVQRGLLEGTKTKIGLRVSEKSIVAFAATYIPLRSIAHALGTSSRALIGVCDRESILRLVVRRKWGGERQIFVKMSDKDRVALGFETRL
jgi:hypothetical protein